jgi:hypothetical protein
MGEGAQSSPEICVIHGRESTVLLKKKIVPSLTRLGIFILPGTAGWRPRLKQMAPFGLKRSAVGMLIR